MSFTDVPTKTTGATFTEAMYDTYIRDNFNMGVWRPIASTTLTATATSVTLTDLQAGNFITLTALILVRSTDSSTSTNLQVRFNADTSNNYWYNRAFGSATSTGGSTGSAASAIVGSQVTADTAPTGVFTPHLFEIGGLEAGAMVTTHWVAGSKRANTTGNAFLNVGNGYWGNTTDALTTINFTLVAGDFAIGSSFTLYGMGDI